jgi:hypothetical protein
MDDLSDRVLCPAPGPVGVARWVEAALEDRLQDELEGHLDHAVAQGGDPKRAELSLALGYQPLAHRQRPELAGLELAAQLPKEPLHAVLALDVAAGLAIDPGRPRAPVATHPRPGHQQRGRVADQVPQIAEPALGIRRCPLVQLALEVKYPLLRLIEARQRRTGVHRRPPSLRTRRASAAALPHVPGSPRLGLLRRLRHAPAATADGAPAPNPRVRRAPPGRFPRSPSTGRQGRRPALPLRHRRAAPQHAARPRTPDLSPSRQDGLH